MTLPTIFWDWADGRKLRNIRRQWVRSSILVAPHGCAHSDRLADGFFYEKTRHQGFCINTKNMFPDAVCRLMVYIKYSYRCMVGILPNNYALQVISLDAPLVITNTATMVVYPSWLSFGISYFAPNNFKMRTLYKYVYKIILPNAVLVLLLPRSVKPQLKLNGAELSLIVQWSTTPTPPPPKK